MIADLQLRLDSAADPGTRAWFENYLKQAALIRQDHAEDKFAGTLYIQKHLLRRVDPEAILVTAEDLFAARAFFDWSTCDWFSVRVLGPLIARHGKRRRADRGLARGRRSLAAPVIDRAVQVGRA